MYFIQCTYIVHVHVQCTLFIHACTYVFTFRMEWVSSGLTYVLEKVSKYGQPFIVHACSLDNECQNTHSTANATYSVYTCTVPINACICTCTCTYKYKVHVHVAQVMERKQLNGNRKKAAYSHLLFLLCCVGP